MKPEGLLLCLQELTSDAYPEPDASNPHRPNLSS
jgi:hypothetical protein